MALNITTEFKRLIFLINHPIGSLYLSTDTTNPNTFYNGNCGIWTQISGYYLYADTSVNNTNYTGKDTQQYNGYSGGTYLELRHLPGRAIVRISTPSAGSHGPAGNDWQDAGWVNGCLDDIAGNPSRNEPHSHTINHNHNIATKGIIVWQRTA